MEDNLKDNKTENFNNVNLEILKIKNYNKIKPENRIQTGLLINREIMNYYLKQVNDKTFLSIIDKIRVSNNIKDKNILITNEDLDKNGLILKIIKDFYEINRDLYNKINEINISNIEPGVENCKILSSVQGKYKLFYIDDFDIVNVKICDLIKKKLSLKYLGNLCKFIIGKNYFLFHFYLSIKEMPTLTEICKLDKNNIFKTEYAIKYKNNFILLDEFKAEGIDSMMNYINKNTNNNIYVFGNNKLNYYKIAEKNIINVIKDEIKKIENHINKPKETTLDKLIYLYYYYFLINNQINDSKNNIPFDKVYLIKHETFLKIKTDLSYKLFADELNEKMNKNQLPKYPYKDLIDIKQIKKSLSQETIQIYDKKKINQIKDFYSIEPDMNAKLKDDIIIMDNFEILDSQLVKYFFENYKDKEKIEAKCSFKEGYVIIHLPKYLNQGKGKYITLIGKLEFDSKMFITEFIFIFFQEIEQENYIEEIMLNKFNNYLNSIKNEYTQITSDGKIIGTIIKNKNNDEILIPEKEKIGLENIGATCYMNATLQCFSHIKQFVNYFTKDKYNTNVMSDKETLSYSFKILLNELWINKSNNKKKYYAPYEFKEKISKLNPLFKGIAANDAKDLINFIVITLHTELNSANSETNIFSEQIIDQTNKTLMFQLFKQEFIMKYNSISSQLFYAINYNITQCCDCGIQIFNYQVYFFLLFPLEEVRKFINNNQNNVVDIMQCFEYDRRICLMTGDNAMYCNRCKRSTICNMCTNLVYAPNVLIIILNRGKGKQFDIKLNFREDLDITGYIEITTSGTLYKLIGVITHLGESSMSGHFIAFCKDPFDNKWYKFNDAIVTPVKDFQKEVIDYGMPYLLFFQKCG